MEDKLKLTPEDIVLIAKIYMLGTRIAYNGNKESKKKAEKAEQLFPKLLCILFKNEDTISK